MQIVAWTHGGKQQMAESKFLVFVGDNFQFEGKEDFAMNADYLKRKDVHYDTRANFLSRNVDLSNWQWYFNYLDFMQTASSKNPNAKPSYLLDFGYVPVVYLPSPFESLGVRLMEAMAVKKIPYIKMTPTSFATKYCSLVTVDAWVSKMDVYKRLGCRPEEVTSEMIIRRLILDE